MIRRREFHHAARRGIGCMAACGAGAAADHAGGLIPRRGVLLPQTDTSSTHSVMGCAEHRLYRRPKRDSCGAMGRGPKRAFSLNSSARCSGLGRMLFWR